MPINENQMKKLSAALIILVLGIIVFIAIRPVLLSVIAGLILAYIFIPVHKAILKKTKRPNLSAFIVILIIALIVLIPLWLIFPLMVQQIFDLFRASQTMNIQEMVKAIFPSSSMQFITQMSVTFNSLVSEATSTLLHGLVNFLVNLPITLLHLFIIGFVCFFALRDEEELKDFAQGLSPFHKDKESSLIKHFKDVTDSVVYGQIIVGLVQGLLAGLGFLIFAIPNTLLLTTLAVLLSIVPIVGPALIWIPITVYLLIKGPTYLAVIFLVYNLFIVSMAEHIIRTRIVSKRTELSQVVVLVGMVGGLFIFGILGIIIGPLILAYFLTFLKSYRDQTLYSLFAD